MGELYHRAADPSTGERTALNGWSESERRSEELGVEDRDRPLVDSPQEQTRRRVAMFVLNPCHIDARVRKEAASLGDTGYEVRIFALGNNQFPEGVVDEGSFTIQRLEVSSLYQRTLWRLAAAYRAWLEWGNRTRQFRLVVRRRKRLGYRYGAAVLFAPLVLLARGGRGVGRGTRRLTRGGGAGAQRLVAWLTAVSRRQYGSPAVTEVDRRRCPRVLRRLTRPVRRTVCKGAQLLRRAWSKPRRWARWAWVRGRRGSRRIWVTSRRRGRRARWACRRQARLAVRSTFLWWYGFVRRRLMPIHRPSVMQQFWRVSARAAVAWEPDVCHAHDLNVLPGAARVARNSGAKLVYDSHELWRRRNRHGELRPLARVVDALQERRLIGQADLVITVSPGIQHWLRSRYGLDVPVEVLRNVPLSLQDRDGPPLRELAALGDERIVMYTGRITSGRGLEETVDALAELPEDVVLVMLGYGDDLFVRRLHHRADRRGVAHRVRQIPPVSPSQVSAVASQADCALVAIEPVCLSYYFTLPNKLFEAIQAGLPVLASDLPDMRGVVEGYKLGRLFQTGRPGEVRDGLSALLADLDVYRANAVAAAEELRWERESEVLHRAYAHLLNGAATEREVV